MFTLTPASFFLFWDHSCSSFSASITFASTQKMSPLPARLLEKNKYFPSGETIGLKSRLAELIALPMFFRGGHQSSRLRKLIYKSPSPKPSSLVQVVK